MKFIRISSLGCSRCIITYPLWKSVQEKYPEYEYVEYDYDLDENEIKKYEIGNILPVILIYKNNQEIKKIIGEKTQEEFFNEIEEVIQ